MTTVAVIEDNPDNRLLVRVLLEDRFTVVEYENGKDALIGFETQPPDLVLLDISLPGMDGSEVLRAIRLHADLAGVPVIALTAHAMAGDREKYLGLGFDDYLAKPITDETALFVAIGRLLGE
jgi:CheY-like chemotaxis protein